jgi:DnaJ-class molecular chaperone
VEQIFEAFFGRSGSLSGSVFEGLFGFGRRAPTIVVCEHCRGNGAEPGTPILACGECDGAGQLRQVARTPFGQMAVIAICHGCHGAGKVPEHPCEECGGAGRLIVE